jgi:dolichol-phosphate mannosyltransferase
MANHNCRGLILIGRLSLACPAYNESEGIAAVLTHWIEYLEASGIACSYEIVVCNDGSQDSTGCILEELAQKYLTIKPVHHVVNRGAAAALTTAIEHTTGDWVLLLDSDGQFPVENVEAMWQCVVEFEADAVIGYRTKKEDSAFARFGSWASGVLCGAIYGRRLCDFNSALKLVRGPVLRSLQLEAKGLNYSTEVTGHLLELDDHVKVVEVEATHIPRRTGRSSRTLIHGAWHRLLFVGYLAVRRFLQTQEVIQRPHELSVNRRPLR